MSHAFVMLDSGVTKEKVDFLSFLLINDGQFIPLLSSRVDLKEYSSKLIKNSQIYSLVFNGENVAYASIYLNDVKGNKSYIPYLAVSPNYQGRGYARKLMNYVLLEAKSKKFKTTQLSVRKVSKAFLLYKSLGFVDKECFQYDQATEVGHILELDLVSYGT